MPRLPAAPPSPHAPAGPRPTAHGPRGARGFTLAGVLVIMAVLAILGTVAAQTATFQKRRENEEELIFRGQQIVEAVRLFRARNGRFPITLEELTKAKPRVLRKTWADPMTGKPDWIPVFLGQEGQALAGGEGSEASAGAGGPGGLAGGSSAPPTPTPAPLLGGTDPSAARGPIVGVRSRSCEQSIRVWEGRNRYCDWKFIFDEQGGAKGGAAPGPTPKP
ncbi:MAG: type II secretion system protein [Acidobacteriota bacterium]